VEIVFYLALPGYAWLVARAGHSARSRWSAVHVEWVGVAAVYAIGLGVRWLLEATSPVPWKVWHGFLPVWFDLFALGFGLAVLSVQWSRAGGAPRPLQGPHGAVGCWLGAACTYVVLTHGLDLGRNPLSERSTGQAVAEEVLWGLFAVLLVLPAVAGTPRLLTWRPVALLGLVSYGIYLWHQAVVESLIEHTGWNLFQAPFSLLLPAVVLLTAAVAALSYRLVERPGISLGHRYRTPLQDRRERLAVSASGRGRPPGDEDGRAREQLAP
jgi:peptidoglycan/LPS O-acetylase OafA/YrhL